jgi:histidinol-phosphatase (PHP family)
MKKFDFHTHTTYSHGDDSPEKMIATAQKEGIATLGISEHLPRLTNFRYSGENGKIRGLSTWGEYLMKMRKLRDDSRNQQTKVLLGCEVDWVGETHVSYYQEQLREGEFDYTIGSVHFIGEIGFDYEADWEKLVEKFGKDNIIGVYEAYFAEYVKMVESGLFDIAGHLDLIKIFRDKNPLPAGVDILKLADKALIALKKAGMVMEINTAGFAKGLGEFYPSEDILRKACEMGIPITFGSDAHSVKRVGDKFEEAMDLAKKVGYTEITVFREGGKRESVKI